MHFFSDLIHHYGALGAFLAALTEEIIVPIPSALVMVSSGFLILGSQPVSPLSLFYLLTNVAIPIALGLTFGSLIIYTIFYYLGQPAIVRWGRYLGVSWSDIEKLERYFDNNWQDDAILFGLRLVPLMPSVVVNIFSGLTRFPLWKYLILTFVGILIRAYVVSFFGWRLGRAFRYYGDYFSWLGNLGLLLVFVLVALLWWHQKSKRALNNHA